MYNEVQVRNIATKFSCVVMVMISALVMMIAVQSVSATCGYILHQPDVPEDQ